MAAPPSKSAPKAHVVPMIRRRDPTPVIAAAAATPRNRTSSVKATVIKRPLAVAGGEADSDWKPVQCDLHSGNEQQARRYAVGSRPIPHSSLPDNAFRANIATMSRVKQISVTQQAADATRQAGARSPARRTAPRRRGRALVESQEATIMFAPTPCDLVRLGPATRRGT